MRLFFCVIFIACFSRINYGQTEKLTPQEIRTTIDSLCIALEKNYFDTNLCQGLVQSLKDINRKGRLEGIQSPILFESKLDSIIRAYTRDDHFKMIFDTQWVTENAKPKNVEQHRALLEIEKAESKKKNYGFQEVKILGGNIGLLKFSSFENPEFAASTLSNAMGFLQNTDAVILDLRNNSGGYTEMMALVCSYFINTNEDWYIPLTEMRLKKNGKEILIQNNAIGAVGSAKMLHAKLYILTNYRTFSAAEWTSFVLKNRRRAIIIGEKTAGGTHPTNQVIISKKFSINIPIGTMVDAVTQSHFEGIGVIPDVNVNADDALTCAQIHYFENTAKEAGDHSLYQWELLNLKSELKPIQVPSKTLSTYEGKYGIIELKLIGSTLYSIREGIQTALIPLTDTIFKLSGRDDMRIKMIIDTGKAIGLERLYEDGTVLKASKN